MNATYKLAVPDDAKAEIILRGTVGDFKELEAIFREKEAGGRWPLGELREAITTVISRSTAQFQAEGEQEIR